MRPPRIDGGFGALGNGKRKWPRAAARGRAANSMIDWRDAVSGAVGAACLTYAGLPFDVVKLRMQTGAGCGGVFHNTAALVRAEGARALWRGAAPALASALIDNVVLFTLQRAFMRLVAPGAASEDALTLPQHALVGGAAGCFSATAICPAELIKCRMQAAGYGGGRGAAGAWAEAAAVAAREGPRGLFRGWLPLLARDVPLQTIFFASYRAHSAWLQWVSDAVGAGGGGGGGGGGGVPAWRAFAAGGLAGSTSWLVIFPLDVVKSRMQAGTARGGALAAAAAVWREGGAKGFTRGYSAAVLRAFPANAALLWGVEVTTWALGGRA